MAEIIRFEKVNKKYGDIHALKDVSISVDKGEFVVVIGTSGCGKTTFLKSINGLVIPSDGSVYVGNENLKKKNLIETRRKMGYCIQSVGLFPHMTVYKNIAYVPNLIKSWSKKQIDDRVMELLSVVGLSADLVERHPGELSGGQQQRVGIARSLAARPSVMLMDEPFGAVDEITRRALQDQILEIHKKVNVTIIFVTHDIEEALKLGTKMVVMNEGQIIQVDSPNQIVSNPKNEYVRKLVSG